MQDLDISLIQADLAWEDKEANIAKFERCFEDVSSESRLVVLPEMFNTGFSMNASVLAEPWQDSKTLEWMQFSASQLQKVITGSLIIEEDGKLYNRLVWMRPDGSYEHYDKRHLFSMSKEPEIFSAGESKLVVELAGWKVCPMVCYDLRFPAWIRNHEGYDLLLFVANWPERRSIHWQQLLITRAIENQCYAVGVNRYGTDGNDIYHDGRTAVVDPLGAERLSIKHIELVANLRLEQSVISEVRQKMPFLNDMDAFSVE